MYGLLIAFQDHSLFKGIWGSTWIGFKNFKDFLLSPYFYITLKNTIILNLWSLCIEFPFAILFALMLNEMKTKAYKSIIQTASFIPYFLYMIGIKINHL